jgi:NADH:ubiquinone oxidoreductase subunit E
LAERGNAPETQGPPVDGSRLEAVLKAQRRTVTVLSSLIAVQDAFGYLPPNAIPAVAAFNDTTVNEVFGVATFYTHFRFAPPGEHTVELCWGPSCHIVGAPALRTLAEKATGLHEDGTGKDGRYTLRGTECAGACALAPVGKLDGKLIGRLTPERWAALLRGLAEHIPGQAVRG